MDKRLDKILTALKRDINPKRVDLDDSYLGMMPLQESDSCIKIDKNNGLTVRISKSNTKTAYVIVGFLLQIMNQKGHKVIVDTIDSYEEFCDGTKEETEEEEDETEPDEGQELVDILKKNILQKKIIHDMKENNIDLNSAGTVVQVMMVDKDDFQTHYFDELPEIPEVRTIKIIIEE